MKNLGITLLFLLCVGTAFGQAQTDILPKMDTNESSQGLVSADGRWSGDLYPKNSEMEITCMKAQVPQVSTSSVGFCLLALGFTLDAVKGLLPEKNNIVGVSTDYYDIVSWGKTRIIAETDRFQRDICPETRQLVLDFPSNTVTLTSSVSITKKCTDMLTKVEKTIEPVTVYSLQHAPFTSNASKDLNPDLKEADEVKRPERPTVPQSK